MPRELTNTITYREIKYVHQGSDEELAEITELENNGWVVEKINNIESIKAVNYAYKYNFSSEIISIYHLVKKVSKKEDKP